MASITIRNLDDDVKTRLRVRGAVLVTRNVRDFQGTGVEVVDPWATG